MNLNLILIDHIQHKRIIEALKIIDDYVDDHNDFLLLRALLREIVSDLAAARTDVENYHGNKKFLKNITKARILAKLGYVDQSYAILKKYPLTNVPLKSLDSNGVPLTLGITYNVYDLERIGIYSFKDFHKISETINNEILFNFLTYSLLTAGAFETLEHILINSSNSFNNLKTTLKNLKVYDSLPRAENIEDQKKVIKDITKDVRGWLSISEGLYLWNLARSIGGDSQIVEIGSFHGRSTICLASGSLNGKNARVYSIDPHMGIECYGNNDSLNSLEENVNSRKLNSNVEFFVDTSLSASKKWSDQKIGLLFIDALHDYENVKTDFLSWSRYLSDGSFVIFHDSVQPGVNKLILEILKNDTDFEPLGLRDSLFVFKKTNENYDEMKNDFFYTYLEEKGQDHNDWIERDSNNLLNFSLYLLKQIRFN